ncbi:MAG: translational GTPase TypA [Chloroflexi bacterium]|nr:translational GTPase TypA [Chloroflexota bacterium]MQF86733.1 translational GTPase TypA [SAR202 cluster bacterium]|tara:strand:- start:22040 stop:23875 length:1836 start_codon:yes stop_codon:yes gene_type:complete
MNETNQMHLRNIAIVAHVDHGKTSLVDAMLHYSHVFRPEQQVANLIMDSDPQERERGITILAKNTGIQYGDVTINIIDTPGHADFSGEVERVINMADGCLLLVDAVEGPMPQTRYVLRIALQQGLRPIVVINKIDRDTADTDAVLSSIQDLFLELATDADQLDFPVIYASARDQYAITNIDDDPKDMSPLFETIIKRVPPPKVDPAAPFQLLVAALDYDNYLGQIVIGRVTRGSIEKGQQIALISDEDRITMFKVERLFIFRDLIKKDIEGASAGEIIAISGLRDVKIGDTIASPDDPQPLERMKVEDPTVRMTFAVNTSPFSGRDGQYATSRMLWDRLQRELQTNVALRVEKTDSADEFLVSGRGELHLSVLIEKMRREGIEFQVSRPEAVTKFVENILHEPYEMLHLETREDYIGVVTEDLSNRLAVMTDMQNDGVGNVRLNFRLPTRGLIGFQSFFLRATRGNGLMNTEFLGMEPAHGEIKSLRAGALVSSETGVAVTYGLQNAQERAETFVEPQTPVYKGMIVGRHNRDRDMDFNVCKERKITNMRSATQEIVERLAPAVQFSLEEALSFVNEDELIEITPKNIRMRKRILDPDERYRVLRNKAKLR